MPPKHSKGMLWLQWTLDWPRPRTSSHWKHWGTCALLPFGLPALFTAQSTFVRSSAIHTDRSLRIPFVSFLGNVGREGRRVGEKHCLQTHDCFATFQDRTVTASRWDQELPPAEELPPRRKERQAEHGKRERERERSIPRARTLLISRTKVTVFWGCA